MDELLNLLDNVINMTPEDLLTESVDEITLGKIEVLNRGQLKAGHADSTGKPLFSKKHNSGTYSKYTEEITGGEKVAGDPYDLDSTGDFHKSIKAAEIKGGIVIDADPVKPTTNLFNEYGEDIVGLTELNIDKIADEDIIPKAQDAFIRLAAS